VPSDVSDPPSFPVSINRNEEYKPLRRYTEAIDLLYSKPTFLFQDPQAIIHFARTILPRRLDLVQSMEIVWDGAATRYLPYRRVTTNPLIERESWNEAWKVVAKMRRLREIRARIRPKGALWVMKTPELLVQPMKDLSGVKVQLVVPIGDHWRFSNLHEGCTPFELVEETFYDRDPWFFADAYVN
jgi:hypothetical protein